MDSGSQKTVGIILGLGMILQVACASLASITGNCPVSMSVPIAKTKASSVPPCHQSKESKEEKSSPDASDCCGTEFTLTIADSIKALDWEKLATELIVLDWFFPKESAPRVVFENVIIDENHSSVSSPPNLLSILQVFLI